MDSRVKELFSCADAHLTIAVIKVERQTSKNIILWSAK